MDSVEWFKLRWIPTVFLLVVREQRKNYFSSPKFLNDFKLYSKSCARRKISRSIILTCLFNTSPFFVQTFNSPRVKAWRILRKLLRLPGEVWTRIPRDRAMNQKSRVGRQSKYPSAMLKSRDEHACNVSISVEIYFGAKLSFRQFYN